MAKADLGEDSTKSITATSSLTEQDYVVLAQDASDSLCYVYAVCNTKENSERAPVDPSGEITDTASESMPSSQESGEKLIRFLSTNSLVSMGHFGTVIQAKTDLIATRDGLEQAPEGSLSNV